MPVGKPFVKGQSGNPGGRPKEDAELKRIIDEKTKGPEYFVTKLMDFIDYAENHSVKLAALVKLMEYRFGKPREALDITTTGNISVVVDEARKRVLGGLPVVVEEKRLEVV